MTQAIKVGDRVRSIDGLALGIRYIQPGLEGTVTWLTRATDTGRTIVDVRFDGGSPYFVWPEEVEKV